MTNLSSAMITRRTAIGGTLAAGSSLLFLTVPVMAVTRKNKKEAPPAPAPALAFTHHQEQNIDNHQVGWIDIAIDPDGHGTLTHSWSNGKQIAGNTFYSVVALVRKDGTVIYSDKQEKGIDGSWFGSAREGHVTTNFTLKKDDLDAIDHVLHKMGAMNCGVQLSSFKCCDNGIDLGFSTRPCSDVPKTAPHVTGGNQSKVK